ncbi:Serine/threonine-protein phosphatase 4 catalytic subunit [Tritrichomonas foetus]|uniref:Serine/threonine-protein phosphatase n=1 Tax=Tritrichomonas foetus TaxID=1144522 RepID=A0A1J4KGX2_9EUKA|nr:Serine/threonine-protein phosphatase 4 catalytic subunit [Tritrichomonas foetus]|eukprot:OHT09068.1 Serine/threonine-protein phosphatase 4 catalytic subunit [Tritrichomonas foetus]
MNEIYNRVRKAIFAKEIVPEDDVMYVLFRLLEKLITENNIVTVSSDDNLYVVGDIHGQIGDMIHMFTVAGEDPDQLTKDLKPLQYKYVFMGDYVDRGYSSLNTFLLLATYKLECRQSITLLRGNHESRQISRTYGFYNECVAFYGHAGVWVMANEVFDLLPLCALIDTDIFCVHGGLSPQIRLIERISLLNRQDELPAEGPIADLTWSDPDNKTNDFHQNPRGAGYIFGEKEVKIFTRLNRLSMICRSHQLAMDGYQPFFGDENEKGKKWRLVTIWSAPDYCYRSGNKAAIYKVDRKSGSLYDDHHMLLFDTAVDRYKPEHDYDYPTVSYYFT